MKWILVAFLSSTIGIQFAAATNLSDTIDKNEVPAEQEQRAEETINQPDAMDDNKTPNIIEEREQQEEWREDYSKEQKDEKNDE